jgi:hypothetical protein
MDERASKRDDRRRFRRSIFGMPIQAVRHASDEPSPNRTVKLHVLNMSRGGVGAVSPEEIGADEVVTLFFPPMGPFRGRDTSGRVVRCDRCEDRYTVGIAFEEPWPKHEELRLQ